jgi:hypothetical protein
MTTGPNTPGLLALTPLVEPHPVLRLHRSSLNRRVRRLEPEPERVVVEVCEVGVGITLELADVGGDLREVSGRVTGSVGVVSGL